MKFVNIEEKDLIDLAKLFKEEFNKEPWNEPWSEKTSYQHLSTIYKSCGFIGYKVYDDSLIGFVLGQCDPCYDGLLYWIKELCVVSLHKGKGYGKQILNELENKLKEKEIKGVLLWTNHATIPFYQKCGYQVDDDLVIMKKVLE